MEPTVWLLVALGASFVVAVLWRVLTGPRESDPGRIFSPGEIDRLLDRLDARRPKARLAHPKRS